MATRNDGIDLLNDPPDMYYLASLLAGAVGLPHEANGPNIEEFRVDLQGFYVRIDGQEAHIDCVGLAGPPPPMKIRTSHFCPSCGGRMTDGDKEKNGICIECVDEGRR